METDKIDSAKSDKQVADIRADVYILMDKIAAIKDEYMKSENGFSNNDKILVFTRAVNGFSVYWAQNLNNSLDQLLRDAEAKVKAQ